MAQTTNELTPHFLLNAYEQISRIRNFETASLALTKGSDALIVGSAHFCAGQEAIPTGALAALRADDQVVATYRGHGWALQSGITARELMAELCHRAEGINGGRAGSALVTAPQRRFIGENSIVGAGLPIACGAALAAVASGSDRVVIVSFGDGATSQGAVHEALVFAVSRQLPVIFVCENNGWSEMTPTSHIVKVPRLARRMIGYGMPGFTIDGTDPLAVHDCVAEAAELARRGGGPTFIECMAPRLWGHYNRDIEHYRPKADRQSAVERDPLVLLRTRLLNEGLASSEQLNALDAQVKADMDAVVELMGSLASPDGKDACAHVIAAPASATVLQAPLVQNVRELSYIQAVNEALRVELRERDDVLIFGEDVGKAGGIFGATRDLQKEFGAHRVFDTPIAESAILGGAVGAAMSGKRPVVEIMWADFMLVALDQLINQAANVRYLTRGQFSAPMVVRTQQGATPGSCAQHAQCLEALLTHIPGLRVGLPSCPQDAYSMLREAIADPDPCVIIESRALYQTKAWVDVNAPTSQFGKAALRVPGKDLLLVGWGTTVPLLLEASQKLAEEGVQAAVLDMRWLAPLDEETLAQVLADCGWHMVIAHEANLSGGFGAEVVARMVERHPQQAVRFRRVGGPNTRMPAAPALQAHILPSTQSILIAARELISTGGK